MEIDIQTARQRVRFDPATGRFVWIVSNRGHRQAGDEAGSIGRHGYRFVKIAQRKYVAHRLAWALFYDQQPPAEIDHIDGNPGNNAILNLRAATRQENCWNNGGEGVRYEADRKKWLARICKDGVETNLGRFDTKDEAVAARQAASKIMFGTFARAR